MNRRPLIGSLIGAAVCLALLGTAGTTAAQARTQVEFWYGLANPLGGLVEQIVADFNASQSQYEVKPTFKGSYPETMVAAIAAWMVVASKFLSLAVWECRSMLAVSRSSFCAVK